MSKTEDEKDGKSDKSNKPKFFSRFLAYVFDSFIVLLISTLLATPFVNSKDLMNLMEESNTILDKYVQEEISDKEYTVEVSNLKYKMDRSMELVNIMGILIGVLYFVVYPLYHNGQTLGKKITKIRVISREGDLTANQLIFRSFIANSILLKTLSVLFVMFASRSVYNGCVDLFADIQYAITIVSVFMIVYGKEGLAVHDKLTHTKVINNN